MRERWVIKVGSQVICRGGPLLIRSWMQQVAELRHRHRIEVIWVTSGAIASAEDRTRRRRRSTSLTEKQALSAVGQPILMDLYNMALNATGLTGAQILLTYDDLAHSVRRKNFQGTIGKLLKWNMVPILNENDSVATEEIRFGDNDSLSAKVARFTNADRLLILTDVDGLFDRDPNKNKKAQLITRMHRVPPALLKSLASSQTSKRGTGGIYSKLQAAREASRQGINTWLLRGDQPGILLALAQGKEVGTWIQAVK
jgi:glutamate 5-kinase